MTHTPGPWKEIDWHGLIKRPHTVRAIVAGEKIVATIDADITGCRGTRGDYSMFCDHTEGWENSHLIAAAPDLLEALELCFVRLESKANTCHNSAWKASDQAAYDAARKAIAKARGES